MGCVCVCVCVCVSVCVRFLRMYLVCRVGETFVPAANTGGLRKRVTGILGIRLDGLLLPTVLVYNNLKNLPTGFTLPANVRHMVSRSYVVPQLAGIAVFNEPCARVISCSSQPLP